MKELAAMGDEQTRKVLVRHGAREPFYGVKVGDLKKIVRKVKKDHELALALWDTGNSDAMYLAALIADEKKISREDLQKWVREAYWYWLSEYAVAWVAAVSPYGLELAREWIGSDHENIAASGWATLSSLVATRPDNELPMDLLQDYLEQVGESIHRAPNRVRYTMNNFVIATGTCVRSLAPAAVEIARKIGKVSVDMGGTACKVPLASEYIRKVEEMGRAGRKKKIARC
jgi:3-methyladenine DNA glycosylase AlkD